MPTPLTPDEEFDAHFRRGLEHYPDLPDDPAAWLRMETLLDAEPPTPAPPFLRRPALRLLGGVVVLVLLLAGLGWHYQPALRRWAARPAHPAQLAGRPAAGVPSLRSHEAGQELATASGARSAGPNQTTTFLNNSQLNSDLPELPESADTHTLAGTKAVATNPATAPIPARAPAGGQSSGVERTGTGRYLPTAPTRELARRRAARPVASQPASSPASHYRQPDSKPVLTARASPGLAKAATPAASQKQARHRARAGATPLASPVSLVSLANARPGKAHRASVAARGTAIITLPETSQRHTLRPRPARLAEATPAATVASRYRAAARRSTAAAGPPREFAAPAGRPLAGADERPLAVDTLAGTGQLRLRPAAQPPVVLRLARVTPFDSLPTPKPLVAATYRLHLGLLASPELNTVRRSPAGLGGSVGFQVEYQLARRWRLSTGYLQAIKRYEAAGSDYQLAAQWSGSWVLSDVTANCRIIDVPLNLRFDVWQQPQRRAFVSGGLSSLFMRREDYRYTYDAGGKTYSTAWQFLNNSNHPFQVLNLSAGYEQNLSARWALQVEPYFKLPLGGIGYGAVRLQSAGVFFSLKYGLLRAAPGR